MILSCCISLTYSLIFVSCFVLVQRIHRPPRGLRENHDPRADHTQCPQVLRQLRHQPHNRTGQNHLHVPAEVPAPDRPSQFFQKHQPDPMPDLPPATAVLHGSPESAPGTVFPQHPAGLRAKQGLAQELTQLLVRSLQVLRVARVHGVPAQSAFAEGQAEPAGRRQSLAENLRRRRLRVHSHDSRELN